MKTDDGIPCATPGCDGRVEAAVKLWLDLDADGTWSVYGVNDEGATISCDANEHDNWAAVEGKAESLSAFLEELLPGSTWEGSQP